MTRKKLFFIIFLCILISLLFPSLYADIYTELKLGYGFPSHYQYFDIDNTAFSTYLVFNETFMPYGALKIGVNILNNNLISGFYTGFQKKYDIVKFEDGLLQTTGMILSIPLLGYFENRINKFFFEAGCGSFLTRFNIDDGSYSEYAVVSIFGFLLGAGYEFKINRSTALKFETEVTISAPGNDLFSKLPDKYKDRFSESAQKDIMTYSDPSNLTYSINICISLEYSFLEGFKVF